MAFMIKFPHPEIIICFGLKLIVNYNKTNVKAKSKQKNYKMEMIVAVGKNRIIGRDGTLPWHVPEDLRHFNRLTVGNVVIMGRKTYDSLPINLCPLPNRFNIIFSTAIEPRARVGIDLSNVHFVSSVAEMDAVLEKYRMNTKAHKRFVIGGASIFRLLMDRCVAIHMTRIFVDYTQEHDLVPKENEDICLFPWTGNEILNMGFVLKNEPTMGKSGICEFRKYERDG